MSPKKQPSVSAPQDTPLWPMGVFLVLAVSALLPRSAILQAPSAKWIPVEPIVDSAWREVVSIEPKEDTLWARSADGLRPEAEESWQSRVTRLPNPTLLQRSPARSQD